ncbi:heat shock protein beta-11-like [Alligator mississippiensis]|uniref:Heat shock protein beta-11-like n=1 Tax=Alligator mississippiensis TaxID=8496 RepID=A0A151PCK4_ALLMI|nr:heat shock protein beta-11-like [Alligator mississippiensis]
MVVDMENLLMLVQKEEEIDTKLAYFHLFKGVLKLVQYKFSHLPPKEQRTMYELSTMFLLCLNSLKLKMPSQFRQHSQNDDASTYKVNYTSTIFAELEREVRWEMERTQDFMSGVQKLLAGEGSSNPSKEQEQSTNMTLPQGTDRGFTISQDIKGFAPEELTVKLVGKKVLLTGKKEMQSEDSKGSFSYKFEVFKREWDVPEGMDPNEVTCSISSEGQLRIEAPHQALTATPERNVPIQITPVGCEAAVRSKEGANGRTKA